MSPHVDPRRHVNAAASPWFTTTSELAHTPAQR
ncbi:hypothetical protein chiPu_0026208, partial [Chiloscyllium punctatum]|nr:hypothetical protein [Chiloscyllium punctatum]